MPLPNCKNFMMFDRMMKIKNEIEGYYELYSLSYNPQMISQSVKTIDRVLNDFDFMKAVRNYNFLFYRSYVLEMISMRELIRNMKEKQCQ